MDKINEILQKEFEGKFSYLKTQEVQYDAKALVCCISFLYPENVTLLPEDKELITQYLRGFLGLNARIIFKFKKSFLDAELITKSIMLFFKNNYLSIASNIHPNQVEINKEAFNIQIQISIPEDFFKTKNVHKISEELAQYLVANYCGEFNVEFVVAGALDFTEAERHKEELLKKKSNEKIITPRYNVYDLSKVVGDDILPQPEFLANIKEPKLAVILAGTIERLMKKSYVRQRKGQPYEKYYYKFMLNEGNRRISAIYFCPKSNIEKMDKLVEGDKIVMVADIQKDNNFLTAKIKSISLCEIDEKSKKREIKQEETAVILPQKFSQLSQGNIFDKKVEYNEYIMKNDFVVYDLETTGFSYEFDDIVEIGAVKIVKGEITEQFVTFVRPTKDIPPEVSEKTQITNDMVRDAPLLKYAIKSFYDFAAGSVLVGYNSNEFDNKFIKKAYDLHNLEFNYDVADVFIMSKEKLASRRYKLVDIVKLLEIPMGQAHRALEDALMTARIMLKIHEKDFKGKNYTEENE